MLFISKYLIRLLWDDINKDIIGNLWFQNREKVVAIRRLFGKGFRKIELSLTLSLHLLEFQNQEEKKLARYVKASSAGGFLLTVLTN